MSDLEADCRRLEEEQCEEPTCDGCISRRAVIAAARMWHASTATPGRAHPERWVPSRFLDSERRAHERTMSNRDDIRAECIELGRIHVSVLMERDAYRAYADELETALRGIVRDVECHDDMNDIVGRFISTEHFERARAALELYANG